MSYATQAAEAALPAFQQRLSLSLAAAAIAILNEGQVVALHNQRVRLAQAILADPLGSAVRMAPGVVSDGTTNNGSTDAQLDARVSAVWNSYLV